MSNGLTERLHIQYPVIQAPMAGGVTTTELITEVVRSGGLGMIGAGYMAPEQIRNQIKDIKSVVSGGFGINLFVPNEFTISGEVIDIARDTLQPFYDELNMPADNQVTIPDYESATHTFLEQLKVTIEEKVPVCSFTFGIPAEKIIAELKEHGIITMGTATTVNEAIAIENSGMDAVVVQGSEAGGHRGHFLEGHEKSQIGLMSLIPQVVDHVTIPVIAAGGVMDGRGLTASMCLGAQAVQMGTAFLTCAESGAKPLHKEAILQAQEDQTVLTRAFSGKWARGIHNVFIEKMADQQACLPEFPVQNALTKPLRKASAQQGKSDFMSLWSGQTPRLARSQTVASLFEKLIKQTRDL
ncbi:NAD(P)H-dependent flavin oxidoreductase [Lentibacillus sp. JNUCC-1]|uniref:NAD(P)H-dependent flavin oxidoreductase n=1 Tax=Lentibacillus sp. JNUCC-1 TaxID=2654513 RepID=UPI002F908B14